jgi:hypothetical protein
MVDRAKEAKRAQAEERFKKVQAAEAAAKEIIESDRAFVRKKTERLRALRLAKEAGDGVTEIDKKPVRKRAKKA